MKPSADLPRPDQFAALGSGYSRIHWLSIAVQESAGEVIVTLAPVDWPRAFRRAVQLAIFYTAFVWLAWVLAPQPLSPIGVAGVGAAICLGPLYFPLVLPLLLRGRLPILRFNKAEKTVTLRGGFRQVPIGEVVAICEVIVRGKRDTKGSRIPQVYELQLLFQRQSKPEFWLLTGSWHPSAQQSLAQIAGQIASRFKIRHIAVNAIEGTLAEQYVPGISIETEAV